MKDKENSFEVTGISTGYTGRIGLVQVYWNHFQLYKNIIF